MTMLAIAARELFVMFRGERKPDMKSICNQQKSLPKRPMVVSLAQRRGSEHKRAVLTHK